MAWYTIVHPRNEPGPAKGPFRRVYEAEDAMERFAARYGPTTAARYLAKAQIVGPFRTRREAQQADISTSNPTSNPASNPAGETRQDRSKAWKAAQKERLEESAAERTARFRAAEAMEPDDRIDDLKKAAQKTMGLNYESAEAKAIIDKEDWQDFYPEVDAWGELTGDVIDIDDERYIIIEDLVMIDRGGLDKTELAKLREGYFPVRD